MRSCKSFMQAEATRQGVEINLYTQKWGYDGLAERVQHQDLVWGSAIVTVSTLSLGLVEVQHP